MTLRTIVGTAGHIDHGKTSLVRALTGIDCDRLPEEKARGITIDLGFAHGDWDGVRFGFVDVPGHERFVRNMLAGATGIDLALVVVAADESVKPQTREHLDICRLLAIPAGVVVITKADRVDPDLVEVVKAEVSSLVAGTFLEKAPILAASSLTGEGIDDVRRALAAAAQAQSGEGRGEREDAPARLAIDRAFVVKGFGPVVTGTLVSGRIREGDRLELWPAGKEVRVRGIEVHGESRTEARAGERTSLNLAGVEVSDLHRGQTVAPPGSLALVRLVTAELTMLDPLPRSWPHAAPVKFHSGSAETLGRLRLPGEPEIGPGETRLVQLGLEQPVAVQAGDRFVLRSASPMATIGGGRIVDPLLLRLTGREPWLGAAKEVLRKGSPAERIAFWCERGGESGLWITSLPARVGLGPAAAEESVTRAIASGNVEKFGPLLFSNPVRQALESRGGAVLAGAAKNDRTATSVPLGEFAQKTFGRIPAEARDEILSLWSRTKKFPIQKERVMLPGRQSGLPGEESASAEKVVAAYRAGGLTHPPSPDSLTIALGIKPQIVQGLIRHLVERGLLVRLPGDWIVARDVVDLGAEKLRASGLEVIDVAGFKELFGLTRKLAIPLLEYFDREGVTRREGDRRRIVPVRNPAG